MAAHTLRGALVAVLLAGLAACGGYRRDTSWELPNADLEGTRAVATHIDATKLRVQWRFPLRVPATYSGVFASTPVADDRTVYVQDLQSNVYALDRSTGRLRWRQMERARNEGPNGLAVADGRVYGASDSDAFALSAASGRRLWRRHLTSATEQLVDIAPVPWHDLVFLSTVGYAPGGRGAIYALDAATGAVRWRFDTIERPWPHPQQSGGGGLWYPVSVDGDGRLYAGNSNPTPWGGSTRFPNGAAFPGPVRWTDSLLVLDARTGRLLWHDQVTPHDVRDYDFEATPILARGRVFGAGKAGRVIAWDRASRKRVWEMRVGTHRNDAGPLPRTRVDVCPGLLGGVETPMAYASGRLFVPVVDLCARGSATTRQEVTELDVASGRGRLVALDAGDGHVLWERRFGSPVFGCATVAGDAVFSSTFDGTAFALAAGDGRTLWRARLRAGSNACPAVIGDLVLFGAGVGGSPEVVAFGG
ncbi:MAG TPA: PQQ-binding-like beta-propeller repeat protein [Gaiellaceae bacterium]|nr:PQQ-binding-like beta-propeller repeat protein [Gaiellaceae bacterium]